MATATSRPCRRPVFRAAWLVVILAGLVPTQVVGVVESPAERAAKRLAWEIEARRSVEVRVRTEILDQRPESDPADQYSYVERYIETALDQRLGEHQGIKDGKVVSHWEDYGDGSKYAHVAFAREDPNRQSTVAFMRQYWREELSDRKTIPDPLLYLYVGRQPLHKALMKAEFVGEGQVVGRPCDAFLFRGVQWSAPQDQVFHLDRETSMPLKVEAYRDQASRERDEPLWVWTAESLDTVAGHPVTLRTTHVAYGPPKTPSMTWKTRVESIEFDKAYPASMFWPTIQPSATVFDAFTGKVRNGTRAERPKTVPVRGSASPASPVQAIPPAGWMRHAPSLTLALGCVVLIAAGTLWWRSR